MAHRIVSVDEGSVAEALGIEPGDELFSINGECVIDLLDYQALSCESRVRMCVRRSAEEVEYEFEKDEYEPIGLNFERPLMSGTRLCCNDCLFCFVDQLPGHARESLRVKDDDWRLSLMTGSYVTLTNLSDRELDRIVKRRASPLYISVHATDPELRARMLGTERAKRLMGQLKKLADGGIDFHAQAVLCPGINDGAALEETISTLAGFFPRARSLALVPVGLTGHREGLHPLRKYARDEARGVLEIAAKWREKLLRGTGTRFVFPSDELYLTAELPIPPDAEYEDYAQVDDGVGLLRLLETEFSEAWSELPASARQPGGKKKLGIACGTSAGRFLREMIESHPVSGADVKVYPIKNGFFGEEVTVSGLLTGGDLIRGLHGLDREIFLITACMLRDGDNLFLDDSTLGDVERALQKPVVPVGRRGDELLNAIMEAVAWQSR